MSEDEIELLALAGRVTPPSPTVLDRARETLWSAVTTVMLATDAGADPVQKAARPSERPRRDGQRQREGPDW